MRKIIGGGIMLSLMVEAPGFKPGEIGHHQK
jgi:hypothetical protein